LINSGSSKAPCVSIRGLWYYGLNQKTVAKWRKRISVADLPTGPRDAKSTVLTLDEEAIIVAFRLDVPPLNWTIRSWNFPLMIPGSGQGGFHESIEVHFRQIAFVLKQAEDGTPIGEVCRKAGISDATFYNWRKKHAGLMPSEMKRLRQLEEDNAKLKRIVADLLLDKAMSRDVLS